MPPQEPCSKEGSTHEYHSLDDIAPDDGFYAAHRTIDDGDDSHQDDADVDVDARHCRQCQRGQVEHKRHACYHKDDEETGSHEAGEGVEAQFQILIGRGDVQLAEVGQVELHHGPTHHEYHDEHRIVGPVCGVGLGRDGHVGDGR